MGRFKRKTPFKGREKYLHSSWQLKQVHAYSYDISNREMTSMKVSSPQGIVKAPIG